MSTIKTVSILLLLLPLSVWANFTQKSEPTKICNASPFGTYCELQVKVKPTPKFNDFSYCGRTYVAITKKQRKVLNSYLVEHKNMVLNFSMDGEFINAPCF